MFRFLTATATLALFARSARADHTPPSLGLADAHMSEDEKAYKISAELPGIDAKGQDEWVKMNIRAAAVATTFLLTAFRERSTSSPPPTPLPPPIGQAVNALTYLAQYRCSDGSPPNSALRQLLN